MIYKELQRVHFKLWGMNPAERATERGAVTDHREDGDVVGCQNNDMMCFRPDRL